MTAHRLPEEDTALMSVPRSLTTGPRPLVIENGTLNMTATVFAIVRDFLIIVTLLAAMVFGVLVLRGINHARQELGQFETTTQSGTLPADRCGGGVC